MRAMANQRKFQKTEINQRNTKPHTVQQQCMCGAFRPQSSSSESSELSLSDRSVGRCCRRAASRALSSLPRGQPSYELAQAASTRQHYRRLNSARAREPWRWHSTALCWREQPFRSSGRSTCGVQAARRFRESVRIVTRAVPLGNAEMPKDHSQPW